MMCCHFGELKDGAAIWCPAHASMGFDSLLAQARKNFAPLVHTDFAAVAKAPCKHGLWLVAREKKEPSVFGRLKNFYANTNTCTMLYTR